jgi:hypothetical protein
VLPPKSDQWCRRQSAAIRLSWSAWVCQSLPWLGSAVFGGSCWSVCWSAGLYHLRESGGAGSPCLHLVEVKTAPNDWIQLAARRPVSKAAFSAIRRPAAANRHRALRGQTNTEDSRRSYTVRVVPWRVVRRRGRRARFQRARVVARRRAGARDPRRLSNAIHCLGFQRVAPGRRRAGLLGRTGFVVVVSVCIVFKVHILVVFILFIFAVFIRASCCRRW